MQTFGLIRTELALAVSFYLLYKQMRFAGLLNIKLHNLFTAITIAYIMKRILFITVTFLGFVCAASGQGSSRTQMVNQLLQLESALLKEDKQKVASFFTFPVRDERLKLKVEYDGEIETVVPLLDKPAFMKHYSRIVPADLLELFRQLDLTQLKTKNELTKTVVPKSKTDFCQYSYEVSIQGQEVEITFMLNTRDDIQLGEDDFCAEYAEFWTFEMVNGKLKYKSIEFAG